MSCFRVTIVAVRKAVSTAFSECVFVALGISSIQCECTVLYCHLLSVRIYSIFPHYLINGMIFEQKVI